MFRWLFTLTVLCFLLGCSQSSSSPSTKATEDSSPTLNVGSQAATANAANEVNEPEVLLSSQRDGTLILAIDFCPWQARLHALTPEERRTALLKESLRLYLASLAERKKDTPPQARIFALLVPDRDEYARGGFRNLTELAIIETTPTLAADQKRALPERTTRVEWKGLDGI